MLPNFSWNPLQPTSVSRMRKPTHSHNYWAWPEILNYTSIERLQLRHGYDVIRTSVDTYGKLHSGSMATYRKLLLRACWEWQIYCMYPAKYLCQSDEWHTKSVSSNVLAFRRWLENRPHFCHTDVMSPRKSTESGRTMLWCFTIMTSIASALYKHG